LLYHYKVHLDPDPAADWQDAAAACRVEANTEDAAEAFARSLFPGLHVVHIEPHMTYRERARRHREVFRRRREAVEQDALSGALACYRSNPTNANAATLRRALISCNWQCWETAEEAESALLQHTHRQPHHKPAGAAARTLLYLPAVAGLALALLSSPFWGTLALCHFAQLIAQ